MSSFSLEGKKTQLAIFTYETEGGEVCFFKKLPLVLVLTLMSELGFRKFQMDEVG